MAPTIEWELYRAFLGVLREGSLSGAARALGVAQPTVGRHVAALEAALGLVLFTRSQTGLLPTEAAHALRAHGEAMESTAAALERVASGLRDGAEAAGTVRISVSEVVGVEVMPAIVADLARRHPALKVELVLSNRVHDLLQREADIAVRMTAPRQEQLVARRVGAIELGLHAHPDYLARRGTPATLADLDTHAVIGYDRPTPFVRQAAKALPGYARERFAVRTDSDVAQLALIRAGAGIGVCQVPLAARAPALVRVLPDAFTFRLDTWVTMHEDLRASPRCRVAFDALVDGLAAYLA
ncbi:LysR family transcriptional regulator [Massilia pinisoli]|uniref:LysR family transcriptional regulator n=1 Tax=Massilia pinisoli TaxID=1772194 RepID=A0ABT1ZJI2_9BURK|nr:LysR family transcriptional regulator [Massilia pinisoli]MCS0580045.1 LysR family transcriptional regulator [Massilia pinisoli]